LACLSPSIPGFLPDFCRTVAVLTNRAGHIAMLARAAKRSKQKAGHGIATAE
jgi:hypothetical protein